MAFFVADRVKETTTSTGTGTINLAGAEAGFQSFVTGVGNGNTTYYAIIDPSNETWEVGVGTVTDADPDTLSRDTILASSNAGSAVDFAAGEKDVFVTQPSDKAVYKDSDSDDVTIDKIQLINQSSHPSYSEGLLWYDTVHNTLNYYGDEPDLIHEVGMEEHQKVYNNSGVTINKGEPMYFSGNFNGYPTVGKADATDVNKYNAQGLAGHDIENNSYGYLITAGLIEDLDTSGLTAGQNFFVGLTPGAIQNSSPTYPNYPMCLGWVVNSSASEGILLVNQQNHSVNSFRVQSDTHIGGDLIIDGDLTVVGSQTVASSTNIETGAPFLYLNSGDSIGEANTTFTGSGLDDAYFAGHFSGTASTTYYVKIDATGTPDTFSWSKDNFSTTEATGVAITGGDQDLDNGIKIDFGSTTGHTLNDVWSGTATPVDTDTGIWSNRNTGATGVGYTHVGMFFDVTDSKFKLVDEYDPEPSGVINTGDSSFSAGSLVVDSIEASSATISGNITVTGTVDGRDVAADGSKLDGIEAGATADQTASEILTLIKTVDGSGSGLDADTLDGINSSSFLRSDQNDSTSGTLSVKTLTVQSNSVGTTSDIALTSNVAINGQNSLSFGLTDSSNGYYRWMFGNTSNTSGIAGGTEKMRLDKDGNLTLSGTVDGRDVATDGTKLDGIETGATADQTAAEILTAIKTVDGSGSGLDADLIDGVHGPFVKDTGTDFNGQYPMVVRTAANTIYSNAGIQYTGSTDTLDVAGSINIAGNRVLTTADEGSGNGLDADTVDTLHASQFLRSDANDTATGLITFSDKVTFSGGTDDQGTLSPAVEISSGTLYISHDEALIVFDQGQKSITSNDGQGNFQMRSGHGDDALHIGSSSGNSGLAVLSLNSDGQEGKAYIGVGPQRAAGSAANFTYSLGVEEGLSGLKWMTGSASYPASLGTSYTVWHSGNDGAGSGLDADDSDTVDGLHASQFLRSDADDTATGQITFPGAIASRPILTNGFISLPTGDGDADIWGISEQYYPSHGTAGNTWGIKWASTPNQVQFVGNGTTRLAVDLDGGGSGLTWEGNTIWHAGNDGSGSGLDADTIDGYHASSFVEQLADTTSPNYQESSSRRVDPNASNPTNHHYAVMTFGNEGNVTGQLATHFQTGQPYTRGYNSSWSAWQKIWTDVNDGSGSGLDADTVDGQHASAFLAVVGDTMSGDIDMNDSDVINIGRINFINHEGTDYGVTGDVMFDENFHSDSEYGTAWTNTDGGGLAVYNEDGWGRILTDRNSQYHTASFHGLNLGRDSTDVLNFTAASTNINRGISFNSRTALSADNGDGWVRLNSNSEFTNGTYSPLKIASGSQLVGGSSSVTSGGQIALRAVTNPYLSWHETAVRRAYIQYLTTDNALFIYNEEAGLIRFRGNAASVNFDFQTTGAANTGRLFVDADDFAMQHANGESIVYGRKDSNTWLYYNGQYKLRTDANGITIRSEANTYAQIAMTTGANADIRGYFYANTSNDIGVLDLDGTWAYRHRRDTEHEWKINNVQRMHLDNNGLRVQTQYGYLDLGPQNASYCHLQTDISQFYFNKRLVVDSGQVQSYDEDLNLNRAGSTTHRLRITSGATISDQPVTIGGTTAQKLILSGATTPYIRWQEGTTDKAYIQWNTGGFFDFRNQETGQFKFQSTVDGVASELFLIRNDTTTVSGDDLGSINFGHTDGSPDWPTQTTSQMPVRIVAEASETTGGSDDGARLRFFTKSTNADKATDSVERMRIENTGYLEMYSRIDMNNNDIQGVDQIFHHGDTNTYMQFHAADQWRVVTGGSERLEVNNTNTTIQNNLIVNGNTTLGNALADTVTVNARDIVLTNGSGDYDEDGTIEFGSSDELFAGITGQTPNNDKWDYLNVASIKNKIGNSGLWFNAYNPSGTFLSDARGQYCLLALTYDNGDADDAHWLSGDDDRVIGAYIYDGQDHYWHAGNSSPIFNNTTVKMKLDQDGRLEALSFNAVSDKRLKENITKLKVTPEELKNIHGYTYNFIGQDENIRNAGILAQEVLEILPEAVSASTIKNSKGKSSEILQVDYNAVIAALVNVVNELTSRVGELEAKIYSGS